MSTSTTADGGYRFTSWYNYYLPTFQLTPTRITAIYLLLGFAALYLSDVVLPTTFDDPLLAQAQAAKGAIEILGTATLIFGLTRYSHSQLETVNDRVEDARDELTLLHRVMRHNLRNDLNLIQGHAHLATDADTNDRITRHCDVILDTVQEMIHYTEHARNIRKVTQRHPTTTTIDLSTRLHDIIATHPELDDDIDLSTTIPDGIHVNANPLLEDAIEELLTNAVTHSTADTPTVDIDLHTDDEYAELTITDNGPGLPQTEYDAIKTITDSNTVHSSGLGLWFADWVATHSDGELTINHPEDGGTAVTLRLPRTAATDITPTPVITLG